MSWQHRWGGAMARKPSKAQKPSNNCGAGVSPVSDHRRDAGATNIDATNIDATEVDATKGLGTGSRFKPTDSQRAAIEAVGTSVLVAAGAGSGKTAVLARRCAHLVADARPALPADRLLVVTFTEAAAAEMHERIGEALRQRLLASPANRWLQQQLALLDTASISTIHSFCRQVLNRYFAQADLEPQAPIMDANDASLLRQETARQVFDRFADRSGPTGDAFLDFLAAYGGAGEYGLIQRVLSVDAFLNSITDPEEWMADTTRRLACPTPGEIPSFWAGILADTLTAELTEQLEAVRRQLADLRDGPPVVSASAACLEDYCNVLEEWSSRLVPGADARTIDGICRDGIGAYGFPAAPRLTKKIKELPAAELDAFKIAADIVRNTGKVLFKKRLKDAYGRFTAADWADGIARTRKHVQTFLWLIREVRKAYQQAKRELGVVDFADLERMTLDLLRDENTGVAARLRNRYEHVLVDEFQDVNPVQAEIIRLVSREGESDRAGNLFAVGDVKQSIYRFRLAEPRLFLKRQASFSDSNSRAPELARGVRSHVLQGHPPTERPARDEPVRWVGGSPDQKTPGKRLSEDCGTGVSPVSQHGPEARATGGLGNASKRPGVAIDLLENFRSQRRVIDAINAVFERLMAPDMGGIAYDEHARLKEGPRNSQSEGEAGQKGIRGPAGDADRATAAALELHVLDDLSGHGEEDDNGPASSDAFDWERIEREAYVIAARIKSLVRDGTPYGDIAILLRSMQPRAGLFLRTLSQLGIPVFADSSGGFFDALEVIDILSLLALLDNQQQDIPLAAVLRSPLFGSALTDNELVEIRTAACGSHPGVPFHAAVRNYARQGQDESLRTRLATICDRLRAWRQRVRRRTLADVLWEVYEESGYLAYISGLHDGRQRRANLLRLHEYARQFATFRRQGLHRFLRFINSLQEVGEDLDAGSVVSPSQDVVRVMTIHRSKGLEFPVVILGELGKRFNLRDAQGSILFDRQLGIAMEAVDVDRRITYPTLPHRIVSQAALSESLAEELRVLYVALTRAKERLVLVGTEALSALERDRRRYSGHVGVLPVLDRREAGCMLDWISAAICCQPSEAVSIGDADDDTDLCGTDLCGTGETPTPQRCPLFEVRTYDREQMKQWIIEPPQRTGAAQRLHRCARMEPLEETPRDDTDEAVVETVVRRLTTAYPAHTLTRVPAVAAAGVLKRTWDVLCDDEEPTASWSGESKSVIHGRHRFSEPVFLERARPPDQASRGTWTHEFLQRLDLRRPCDAEDLHAQLTVMVDAGTMPANEAAAINPDDVAWFFQTPLGARLRSEKTRVLREWPFVMGVDPSMYDPSAAAQDRQDLMLVRGIIDCLFDGGDGWEVLDYKTDTVTGDTLLARADEYRGQLSIYAAATEAIWQRKVTHRWLVFLSARQIVEV